MLPVVRLELIHRAAVDWLLENVEVQDKVADTEEEAAKADEPVAEAEAESAEAEAVESTEEDA
jgi:hypothetical protein